MAKVTLIIGAVNAGKTTRLIQISQNLDKGSYEGIACVKRTSVNQVWHGYDHVRLSDGNHTPALTLRSFYHDEFKDFFVYGPFVFSNDAFYQAEMTLMKALDDPSIKTILLDEIGGVELKGLGFSRCLQEALKTDKHLILCVNPDKLSSVLHHFNIEENQIVKRIDFLDNPS